VSTLWTSSFCVRINCDRAEKPIVITVPCCLRIVVDRWVMSIFVFLFRLPCFVIDFRSNQTLKPKKKNLLWFLFAFRLFCTLAFHFWWIGLNSTCCLVRSIKILFSMQRSAADWIICFRYFSVFCCCCRLYTRHLYPISHVDGDVTVLTPILVAYTKNRQKFGEYFDENSLRHTPYLCKMLATMRWVPTHYSCQHLYVLCTTYKFVMAEP
jgi:hypothetical protein